MDITKFVCFKLKVSRDVFVTSNTDRPNVVFVCSKSEAVAIVFEDLTTKNAEAILEDFRHFEPRLPVTTVVNMQLFGKNNPANYVRT